MKTWWAVLIGVIGGLLGAGLLLLMNSNPRGEAVTLAPPPTALPLIVDVSGAVNAPGVYELAGGSRLEDAIAAAGGLAQDAQADSLNLAAPLEDGLQVWVPGDGEEAAPPPAAITADEPQVQPTPAPSFPININTATVVELQVLPGIGETKAQAIVAYREANGAFTSIEDIQNVSGIGPSTFAQLSDLITVAR
ncbi:MAG: helix-hairpin-helix domain-containing protein [Anaerolineales bacterium]|nr:helix-hairpin-helix domain-containing protein [Anaerolineales bacterium]